MMTMRANLSFQRTASGRTWPATLNLPRTQQRAVRRGLALFECSEFRQFPRGGAVLGAAKRSGSAYSKTNIQFQPIAGAFIA